MGARRVRSHHGQRSAVRVPLRADLRVDLVRLALGLRAVPGRPLDPRGPALGRRRGGSLPRLRRSADLVWLPRRRAPALSPELRQPLGRSGAPQVTGPRSRSLHRAPPALLAMAAALAVPTSADASAPAPDLMAKLASYGAGFESLRTRASYTIEGQMETLDRDGNAESVKQMKARVEADGINVKFVVLRYVEDGEDKTGDAQKQAQKRAQERKAEKR